MKHILVCPECNRYTMKGVCSCGSRTANPKPLRYSPDKYSSYRRKAKEEALKAMGLL